MGLVLMVAAFAAGCSAVDKQRALISNGSSIEDTQPAYLDIPQDINAQLIHSARRADLLTIAQYWQMDEPVWLYSLLEAKEVYRLWYRPSLDDWSVVRVVRDNNGWTLSVRTQDSRDRNKISKCLFSKEQTDPIQCRNPRLKVDRERKLQSREVEQLEQQLKSLDFWNQPERVKSLVDFDGVNWVLEGRQEGGLTREAHRYNPPEHEPFYQFADYLLKLADVPQP